MAISFTYFPLRGLGEAIRVTLHDNAIEYKDESPADWPAMKEAGFKSGELPFGQLPLYKDEDGTFVQSKAILRHIGRKFDLSGSTEAEKTTVDTLIDTCDDVRGKYSRMIYVDQMSEAALTAHKALITATPMGPFAALNTFVERHGKDFLAGTDKPTIADYLWWDLVDVHLRVIPELLADFPLVNAWFARMSARPNLKAYVESNPAHRARVNGNTLG